jgi:acyl-CoA thioesterase
MSDLSTIPLPLRPEPISHDRDAVTDTGDADQRDVVFGGQFLAQAIVTDEWLLRGRTFGTADLFSGIGRFVASYVQTNMVRAFADPALADGTQYRTVM